MGEWRHSFTILNLCIRGTFVVSFTPQSLTPGEIALCTNCIGGWVGPRLGLKKKRKFLAPARNRTLIPWSSIPQPSRCTDWALPASTAAQATKRQALRTASESWVALCCRVRDYSCPTTQAPRAALRYLMLAQLEWVSHDRNIHLRTPRSKL
jgi:hypothetical protein